MTDDKELIARLRYEANTDGYDYHGDLHEKAADRIEALTAKLAKAETGLREIVGECGCFIARTTLAEIKGESHE